MIRQMETSDDSSVIKIYAQGLATRNATFETEVPDWEKWDSRYQPFCRLVYCVENQVVGWAALSPVSARHCYRGVAVVSIYIDNTNYGQGIGSNLLKQLIHDSEVAGVWTLKSSVFPENEATVRLHKKYGFRELGIRRKIAQLDNQWRDTLILERRSEVAGL